MNGSAHRKIALISYSIVATVPVINSFPLFNNSLIHVNKGISLAGLFLAGLAGLLVDSDTLHSKISHMNPAMNVINGTVGLIENILKIVLRLLIGVGLGILILKYSNNIIDQFSTIKAIKPYASIITYLIASIFIFSGVTNEKVLRNVPLIGSLYNSLANVLGNISNLMKRLSMFLLYAGSGVFLILYNIKHVNDIYLYIISLLLISIAIFPHRTFLHSLEGAAAFTISASYLLSKIGYSELTGCFFIGYMSHIYWADIFTKEGVPLLSTPLLLAKLLKKLHLHNEVARTIEKIGSIKLRLPPHITTGSTMGNLFENIYILILFILAVVAFIKFGPGISII
ncbi:metal-dependent hydrolase [Clostridium estertheticum]|uniref:metal-dependent hydrolase n=1 Tax=Clostridium estertheticum TaxID=238834 RepID=UPI001C0AE883|nr:metal-dependent hydrolase [Clostridium estertheticum]MBU3173326.1 metal-dependent hydrolase [Clostridium estertheticum]